MVAESLPRSRSLTPWYTFPMRALVVEDEKTPREILRDLVPWAQHGFSQVDTARNGGEALEILAAGDVDLVLTDVRMPKMDGVELALEVRRRWPDTVLLFLSGFSDKEYLKTAIRVQAQDYLEKPIDLAVVEGAVAEASRTIRLRQQSLEKSVLDDQARRELSPLRRQAVALALFGLGPELSSPLEDRFLTGPLRAAVLVPTSEETEDTGWRAGVLSLVNGDEFPFPGFVAALGPGAQVVLACDRTLSAQPAKFDDAVEALLALTDELSGCPPLRVGVSPTVLGPGDLKQAWSDAWEALGDSFYRPSLRVFSVRPDSGRTLTLDRTTLDLWKELLEAQDYPGIARQLDLLEQRALAVRDRDRGRVRQVWVEALRFLLGFVPAWGAAERNSRIDKLSQEMAAARDLGTVAALARECFDRLFVRTPADLQVADRVGRAKQYVENRFADPNLTVDEIASHVGYSESYFCTVFKQAESITVKDFVTRHRIDRAKAYLWEKDPPTLADLALKVGFRDPNYFSTVFKRLTGTSPGAYRKKALG